VNQTSRAIHIQVQLIYLTSLIFNSNLTHLIHKSSSTN